jgi:hypothetical protein
MGKYWQSFHLKRSKQLLFYIFDCQLLFYTYYVKIKINYYVEPQTKLFEKYEAWNRKMHFLRFENNEVHLYLIFM